MRWLVLASGLLFLGLFCFSARRALLGQNDFLAFYTGASLLPRGELYVPEAQRTFQRALAGYSLDTLLYIRPPFHALALRPFTWLRYRAACVVFQLLGVGAFAWFVWKFASGFPALPWLACFSVPAAAAVIQGQDILIVMSLAGGAILLHRAGGRFVAGLLLALCSAKFNLFFLVPAALLFRREWRTLAGMATGLGALAGLSFAVAGWHWPAEYLAVLRKPEVHSHMAASVNLRALLMGFGGAPLPVFIACSIAGVMAAVYAIWRAREWETAVGIALIAGVFLSYHAYVYDAAVLLLAVALLADRVPRWLQWAITLPPLYLGVLFFAADRV